MGKYQLLGIMFYKNIGRCNPNIDETCRLQSTTTSVVVEKHFYDMSVLDVYRLPQICPVTKRRNTAGVETEVPGCRLGSIHQPLMESVRDMIHESSTFNQKLTLDPLSLTDIPYFYGETSNFHGENAIFYNTDNLFAKNRRSGANANHMYPPELSSHSFHHKSFVRDQILYLYLKNV